MYVLSMYELIKINQYYIAIKRTPHFGVWSASPCGLKLGGLRITALAPHPHINKHC